MANVDTNIQIPCASKGQILLCKKHYSNSTKKFSETDIINILEVLIDNILVMFDGLVFHQTVGIPMGTNCAPLLADLFLYSYDQVGDNQVLNKMNAERSHKYFITSE